MDLLTHTVEDRITFEISDQWMIRCLFSDSHNPPFRSPIGEIDWQEWYIDEFNITPIPDSTRCMVRVSITRIQDAPNA